VLAPTLTFIATANAAAYIGARVRFFDAEPVALGLDPVRLEQFLTGECELRDGGAHHRESGRRIAACIVVHVLGHPADLVALAGVCARHGVPLVEDATESLGSTLHGRAVATTGVVSALSFNGNKIITTGGGGMVVTADAGIAARVRHLATQAKNDPIAYLHDAIGYNYRMPNINAAVGCAQLEELDVVLARKRAVAERYRARLDGAPVSLIWEPVHARSNFWLNTVCAPSSERARVMMQRLVNAGVQARPLWTPCHRQPNRSDLTWGPMTVADRVWSTAISLPSSATLGDGDIDTICSLLRD